MGVINFMSLISKSNAQKLLNPYVTEISKVILNSVDEYYGNSPYSGVRFKHTRRTSASTVHDHIEENIKLAFDIRSNTKWFYSKNLFQLKIEDQIVLRFNKFDRRKRAQLNKNQQSFNYIFQHTDELYFNDMPPNSQLWVGYCLNHLETGLDGIYITCRHGNKNVWDWDITSYAEIASIPRIEEPNESAHNETLQRKIRRKPVTSGVVLNESPGN